MTLPISNKLLNWADRITEDCPSTAAEMRTLAYNLQAIKDGIDRFEHTITIEPPASEEMLAVLKSIREGIAGIERATRLGNKDLEHRLQAIENVLVSTAGRSFLGGGGQAAP